MVKIKTLSTFTPVNKNEMSTDINIELDHDDGLYITNHRICSVSEYFEVSNAVIAIKKVVTKNTSNRYKIYIIGTYHCNGIYHVFKEWTSIHIENLGKLFTGYYVSDNMLLLTKNKKQAIIFNNNVFSNNTLAKYDVLNVNKMNDLYAKVFTDNTNLNIISNLWKNVKNVENNIIINKQCNEFTTCVKVISKTVRTHNILLKYLDKYRKTFLCNSDDTIPVRIEDINTFLKEYYAHSSKIGLRHFTDIIIDTELTENDRYDIYINYIHDCIMNNVSSLEKYIEQVYTYATSLYNILEPTINNQIVDVCDLLDKNTDCVINTADLRILFSVFKNDLITNNKYFNNCSNINTVFRKYIYNLIFSGSSLPSKYFQATVKILKDNNEMELPYPLIINMMQEINKYTGEYKRYTIGGLSVRPYKLNNKLYISTRDISRDNKCDEIKESMSPYINKISLNTLRDTIYGIKKTIPMEKMVYELIQLSPKKKDSSVKHSIDNDIDVYSDYYYFNNIIEMEYNLSVMLLSVRRLLVLNEVNTILKFSI